MSRRASALWLVPILLGCTAGGPAPTDRAVVLAAASLTDAFEELAAAYADETGVEIVLSFDASSALRAQVEEGAPADLFVSADVTNPQRLVDEGLTDGGVRRFAANGLAIVVPDGGDSPVRTWTDLAGDSVRIVGAGDEVPITGYALELVENLAGLGDAPDRFAEAYAANVVSREDNVRAVLAKIELGEGDAGIVYETDAASFDDVETVAVPPEANVVADYAFVALANAAPEGVAFGEWLLGDAAQAVLSSHGFRPPSR